MGLLGAGPAAAAPPSNNNFANAAPITGSVVSTNVEATKQGGEPNHAGDQGGASVWYSWTAPSTGDFQLTTCGSQFDTLLAVYTGSSVSTLTPVASNDEAFRCASQSDLVFHATSGVNYKFAVDGYSYGGTQAAETGNFVLVVGAVMPPYNDSFSTPTDEGGDSDWSEFGDNRAATKQAEEPNHAGNGGGASVWYSWTAPITGHYQLNTCNTEIDTVLGVYKGSAINSLTPVVSDHDSCGLGSYVEFDAVSGTQYRIAVDGFNGAKGEFEIDMRLTHPPPNDNFANARAIFGSNLNVAGDNVDATAEPGEPGGFVDGPLSSVWYAWTAPTSGQLAIDTCSSDFDTVLALFTGSSLNGLTRVASNDNATGCGAFNEASKLLVNVTAGTTYRIAVDGYFDAGDFNLRLLLSGAPVAQKDSKAPNAKIAKVKVDSEHDKAKVIFGSNEAGSKYKCKLDKASYKKCSSPKTFRHLDEGKHKVKVVASDKAGNADPTPAVKKFEIE